MKTKSITLYFQLSLFFLLSCSSGGQKKENSLNDSKKISITKINLIDNLDNTIDAFYLSDVADNIELVQLEINPEHVFDEENINNLKITNDYIFLYSAKSGLLQYSRSGKFLQQIGRIGRGPGEYLQLRNYSIYENKKLIKGYVNHQKCLNSYNFNGDFLCSEIPLYKGTSDYQSINKLGKYYFIEQNSFLPEVTDTSHIFNFAITDSLFNEVQILSDPTYKKRKTEIFANRYNPYDSWKNFYAPQQPLVKITPYYIDFLYYGGDTINRITDDLQIVPRYILSLGRKIPFEVLHYRCHPFEYFDYVLINDFKETPNYIFFDFGYKKYKYKACFRKSDGYIDMLRNEASIKEIFLSGHLYNRRRVGNNPHFTNDLNGSGPFNPQWTNEKQWICAYPAYKLKSSLKIDSLKQARVKSATSRDQLVHFIENIKDTDGPLLMIANLKESQNEK